MKSQSIKTNFLPIFMQKPQSTNFNAIATTKGLVSYQVLKVIIKEIRIAITPFVYLKKKY